MTLQKFVALWAVSLFAIIAIPVGASGAQLSLTPSAVIGGSGAYPSGTYLSGVFPASEILDGAFNEPVGSGGSGTTLWLGREPNVNNEYVVINLGAPYTLQQLNLFNTHNGQFNDSGTQNFQIHASNSIVAGPSGTGMNLAPGEILILAGTLSDTSNQAIITPDVFLLNTAPFQFLRFTANNFRAGDVRVGLNEIQVFGTAVPEPSSIALWSLLCLGLVGFGYRRIRRKQ